MSHPPRRGRPPRPTTGPADDSVFAPIPPRPCHRRPPLTSVVPPGGSTDRPKDDLRASTMSNALAHRDRTRPRPGGSHRRAARRRRGRTGLAGPWTIRASRGFLLEGRSLRGRARRVAAEVLGDPVVEAAVVRPRRIRSRRRSSAVVHVLPKPGRHRPRGRERRWPCSATSAIAVAERPDDPHLPRRRARRRPAPAGRASCWPTTPSSRPSSARCRSTSSARGSPTPSAGSRSRSAGWTTTSCGAEPVGPALAQPRRDEDDPRPLRDARPRPDRLRARDPRPDLERALLAQDAAGPDRLPRAAMIDNLLKQTIFGATRELDCDWLVSVFSDNAGVVRFDDEHDVCFKVETHNHPSAIDPYGGANTGLGGVIRDALGTGLGRQADLQHRCLLRGPARPRPEGRPARRAAPEAGAQGGRRGRPRLRQPDGHPDGQRGPRGRPGLSGQSARLLRDGRRAAAGDGDQARRAGRPDRRHRRPDRPRRHPRGDVQLGRADRATARPSPAAPCRSATRSPRRWCST